LTIGAQLTDVVRVRMFVLVIICFFLFIDYSLFFDYSIDIRDQDEVCRAFKETFHSCGIRVPATLVQVSGFVDPDMRVEIRYCDVRSIF
jgi:enamine deaminase RidA (YjgF/YER057c/UK114 family)